MLESFQFFCCGFFFLEFLSVKFADVAASLSSSCASREEHLYMDRGAKELITILNSLMTSSYNN